MNRRRARQPITWGELKRSVETELVRLGVDDPDELVVGPVDIEPSDLRYADLFVKVRGRTLIVSSQLG